MSTQALAALDHSLVLRSQSGDDEATTELVQLLRPVVTRYARRYFPDAGRAEDMAQTALMKAFARVGDLRAPEAIQTWVLRITRNECLNELARHRVPAVSISAIDERGDSIEVPAGGADDPEETLVRVQMAALVHRAADTLPPHYRRTLTMRALEDRSYEEISAELGIPVSVARLWYCRARKRFRSAFVEMMTVRRGMPPLCQGMGLAIAGMIEGTLPRAQRDRVHEHLVDCSVCRQTEDELRDTAFRTPARLWIAGITAWRAARAGLHRAAGHATGLQAAAGRAMLGAGAPAAVVALAAVPAISVVGAPAALRAAAVMSPASSATGAAQASLPAGTTFEDLASDLGAGTSAHSTLPGIAVTVLPSLTGISLTSLVGNVAVPLALPMTGVDTTVGATVDQARAQASTGVHTVVGAAAATGQQVAAALPTPLQVRLPRVGTSR